MASFNYTGFARFTWPDRDDTIQYIDYAADTGTLSVWPEDDTIENREYLGHIKDHPASHIKFMHGANNA